MGMIGYVCWKDGAFGCCVVTLAKHLAKHHLFTLVLHPFDDVNHGVYPSETIPKAWDQHYFLGPH